jgi:MarR family transcriptional regulator, transcriptional regulator for hemolysin
MEKVYIGRELRSLNNLIHRYFEISSHKKEIDFITGTNGWIIGYLADHADGDIFQRDLEAQFTITRSTASKVLNLMEKKGLIERHPVARDARLKKLVLTEKALEIKELMKQDGIKMEQALTKGFTVEELQTLHTYLQRMKTNMSTF